MTFKSLLLVLTVVSIFAWACQREIELNVQQRPTGDSTEHITSMFRVVEIDPNFPGDSSVRIIKRIELNGVTKVIMAEVASWVPTDTAFTLFTYDAQGHLSSMTNGPDADMSTYFARYQFTWTGNRLTKVMADTLGSFAESYDFSYSPSGANSVVTSVHVPSNDVISSGGIITVRNSVTVNSQFLPVSEQWVHYFYAPTGNGDPNLPQMVHDTTTGFFNFSGSDLSSTNYYFSRHDTNTGLPYTNIIRDTSIYSYNRASGSTNLTDSLIKILGSEVYTLMNFDLLDFYYGYVIATTADDWRFFYRRPTSRLTVSGRTWVNGVFDTTYSNDLLNKMDNTFDAAGRLTKASVYHDRSETDVNLIFKFYYD